MPPKSTKHTLRNNKGQFSPSENSSNIRWNKPGVVGFFNWLEDCKPKILTRSGKYQVFEPTAKQVELIKQILAVDSNGNFKHSMSLLIQARRHGKSTVFCCILLFLFTSRKNFTIQLLGNNELHCRRVQYRTLVRITQNTPKLKKLIPEKNIQKNEIKLKSNVIQVSATSFAGSFGDRINCLWTSDLHASPDLESFNAYQAALLDSENSLCLIDSNVDNIDGEVHRLEQASKEDDSFFCDRVEYKDFEQYEKEAPEWIDRAKAKRLKRILLPAEFDRDILGKRSDSKNSLFPSSVIELCKSKYQIPVSDINELTKGRAYKVGSGLDRSKSLIGGDNTVFTTILKVASPEHGEPEYFILNQQVIIPNTASLIKKAIKKDQERYHLDNVTLENYEVGDLKSWLDDQKIPNELISAHDTNQNASFPEFHRIAKEGRLHIPESLTKLHSEMQTFSYVQKAGGKYSFGSASQKSKDDRVYSLNWAIFSLRSQVMNLYTLGSFVCKNKTPKRNLCFLMGGSLELLCKEQCQAYQEVASMFGEYKSFQFATKFTIQEFFEQKVKFDGARISQAA